VAVFKVEAIPLDHPLRQTLPASTVPQVDDASGPPPAGARSATRLTQPLGHPEVGGHIAMAEGSQAAAMAPFVQELLDGWPSAGQPSEPQNDGAQRAVASALVGQPWLWQSLTEDVCHLVVSAVFVHADQASHSDEAARLRQDFAHLLHVNKNFCELTLRHQDRVLFCALRLAPMRHQQLLGTPLHRLLGHGTDTPTAAPYALFHTLRALAAATARLPTDEQACHAVRELGRRLLTALKSPEATKQDRRELLLMPFFMVQALRVRLHHVRQPSEAIAETLRELVTWARAREPALAVPLLLELMYTFNQLPAYGQTDLIPTYDAAALAVELEIHLPQLDRKAQAQIPEMRLLSGLLPDPWGRERTPPMDADDLTQALAFLADYPYDFVGFVSEVLTGLVAMEPDLDEQQAKLMQRCLDRQENPLDRPRPPAAH